MASRGQHHKRIYALYQGEEYIRDGTAAELAAELGVSENTIHFYASSAYKRRSEKSTVRIAVTPIGWDDDDEN